MENKENSCDSDLSLVGKKIRSLALTAGGSGVVRSAVNSINEYKIERVLGTGGFGTVYLAHEKKSKKIVALKICKKSTIAKEGTEHLVRREIEIQSILHHPNILCMYGHFHDDKHIYLILEYAIGGDLHEKMKNVKNKKKKKFTQKEAALYIAQIADGLDYCHRKHIIHRDIKPENVLLGDDGKIKIADFGLSVYAPSRRQTYCGTLDYFAPERVDIQEYNKQADIWSIGVLLYEFLTGKQPFYAKNSEAVKCRIKKGKFDFPRGIRKDAQDLIRRLIVEDPEERMSLREIPKHPWVVRNTPPDDEVAKTA